MKHYGDITKIKGDQIPAVDCITGGSPCQDLSVGGLRAGLDGERSGLFMEQIRIVKEMREHDKANGRTDFNARPRFMVWENVPGAFSSNGGRDFQAVLSEIVKIAEPSAPDVPMPNGGRWPKSGCLYDAMGNWSIAWRVHNAQFWGVPQRRRRIALVADFGGRAAPEVCFERQGLQRDPFPVCSQREHAPGGTETGVGNSIEKIDGNGPELYDAFRHHGWRRGETCGTITAGQNESIRGDTPLVVSPAEEKTSVFRLSTFSGYSDGFGSLRAKGGDYGGGSETAVVCAHTVRRLTPMECERLQGFPDGWTDIGEWTDTKGKRHKQADAPRYKALGNSIALPFWFWLLRRISAQYERPATLGSLFDGIGGFPLCWERCNGKGSALWASEIEEFPIAVTNRRFPED